VSKLRKLSPAAVATATRTGRLSREFDIRVETLKTEILKTETQIRSEKPAVRYPVRRIFATFSIVLQLRVVASLRPAAAGLRLGKPAKR